MAAAWEIVKIRNERILVAILTLPDLSVSMDWAKMLGALQLPPGSDRMEMRGMPFGPARNQAAKTALENGYNLAFLDADLRVPPDAYLRLWATGLPFVSGLYHQRFPPYKPLVQVADKDPNDPNKIVAKLQTGWQPGDIVPVDFVPTGIMLVRRPALEKIFQLYSTPFQWGVDTGVVLDERGKPLPPFSEDFIFSWRMKTELGIQGYVHTGIVGLHETKAVIGPKYMVPGVDQNPIMGGIGV